MLLPLFILIIVISSVNHNFSNYFNHLNTSNTYITSDQNYEDLVAKDDELFIEDAAIQSKIITENYVKLYIKFSESIEDNIFSFNKGLKPDKDIRGVTSDLFIGANQSRNDRQNNKKRLDSLRQDYLKTFNKLYVVEIDTLAYDSDFVVNKNDLGFETYLPTKPLSSGKHILTIKYKTLKAKDTLQEQFTSILFWYYPD